MLVAAGFTANEESATQAGHRVARGFHMLLHQAREQVRLVAGRHANYYGMRSAGTAHLNALAASVVLVGLRCTGKSETGARLARLLGRPFVDVDREVEVLTGRSPDAMIAAGDEAAFREAEARAMAAAFARPGAVVAAGGGAALHAKLLRNAAALWPVVLLDAADDVLLRRWAAAPRAPLTDLPPAAELARQREERMAVYRETARVTLDVSSTSPDETAEAIADLVDWDWRTAGPSARRSAPTA
jgi:shikimate kinase